MKTYEFTLIVPELDDATADAVYGRCRDASVGKSNGTSYVAFDRESASLESAIDSAIADLKRVGVQPLKVEIDLPVAAP